MMRKYLIAVGLLVALFFVAGTTAHAGNIYKKQIVDNHHIIYYCNNVKWDCWQDWQKIPAGLPADWCDDLAEVFFHAPEGCFEQPPPKAPFDTSLVLFIAAGAVVAFRKRFI